MPDPAHFRYDTDRVVSEGDWIIATATDRQPERFWIVLAARKVRTRNPIGHAYRWALTCERIPGPTEDAPYLPGELGTMGAAEWREQVHLAEFRRRPPRHRWRQR